jgi:hypothetical protein
MLRVPPPNTLPPHLRASVGNHSDPQISVGSSGTPLPRGWTHFILNKAVEATDGTDHTNEQGLGSGSPRTCEVDVSAGLGRDGNLHSNAARSWDLWNSWSSQRPIPG